MKYYIAKLEERNGDYEYKHVFRFASDGKPEKALKYFRRTWYSGDPEMDGDVAYFHAGCVAVSDYDWHEVSREVFDSLPAFITDMSYEINESKKEK